MRVTHDSILNIGNLVDLCQDNYILKRWLPCWFLRRLETEIPKHGKDQQRELSPVVSFFTGEKGQRASRLRHRFSSE